MPDERDRERSARDKARQRAPANGVELKARVPAVPLPMVRGAARDGGDSAEEGKKETTKYKGARSAVLLLLGIHALVFAAAVFKLWSWCVAGTPKQCATLGEAMNQSYSNGLFVIIVTTGSGCMVLAGIGIFISLATRLHEKEFPFREVDKTGEDTTLYKTKALFGMSKGWQKAI